MPLAVTIFSYREVFKKIREHKVPRSGTISLHTSEGVYLEAHTKIRVCRSLKHFSIFHKQYTVKRMQIPLARRGRRFSRSLACFFSLSSLQYVVLGPRVKILILNILPESKRSELKFSLKIAFMFLSDNFKVASSKL